MIWEQEAKIRSIIKFTCPLDININRKVNQKLENFSSLAHNLQIMYPEYKFQVALIVIGAMGYVPKCLINYVKIIGFNENESKVLISTLEIKSISGTVKICKLFLILMSLFIILILPDLYTKLYFKISCGIKFQVWILYLYNEHSYPKILLQSRFDHIMT